MRLNKICMLAYYDYIITRSVSFEIITYVRKLAKKQQVYFSFFGEPNQFYVSNYSPIPSCSSTIEREPPHRNKTTNTIPLGWVNVSLPSSIAKTIYFDLDQCLSGIFFKLRRSDFDPSKSFIQEYVRGYASSKFFYSSNRIYTELIQLRYKFQRNHAKFHHPTFHGNFHPLFRSFFSQI